MMLRMLLGMVNLNFTEMFPNVDVRNEFSGLYIGQDGFMDVDQIMDNLNFDIYNDSNFDLAMDNMIMYILRSGKHNYVDCLKKFIAIAAEAEQANIDLNSSKAIATAILESTENNGDTQINNTVGTLLANTAVAENNICKYIYICFNI